MVGRLGQQRGEPFLAGADAPPWAQRMALRLTDRYVAQHPQAPQQIWRCNKAQLPPAKNYGGAIVVVPDQDCFAVSDGTSWRKIVLGGPV